MHFLIPPLGFSRLEYKRNLDTRGSLIPTNVVEISKDTNQTGKSGKRLPFTIDILLLAKGIAETYDDKCNN
jgi:hypothetical protein